ncbi:MAG: type II toxin-antitoxin system VapC family toxin [Chloroflexi bacterium]|nr:type II toxin-antitoxin system VapC family toxin [Chloroflexota bacterium]MCL5273503.1 type II toxin-antitoxin system VapC family toxin [Chloroflexota bacterium]
MKYLLDTNVISEFVVKHPDPFVISWLNNLDSHSVYLSMITIGEVCKGIERLTASKRKESLNNWLHNDLLIRFSDHLLSLDVGVMLAWGKLVASVELAGKSISAMDSLIAAVALHHSCSLVTRNAEHFRYTGVDTVNPWMIKH